MAARCQRFPSAAAEGKRGDVAASHSGLGQAVEQWSWHASFDSLPSTQAIQTAVAAARQWSGWREIVPCDGLVARLHDACCSGARFNLLTSTHRALQPLEKIRCKLVG